MKLPSFTLLTFPVLAFAVPFLAHAQPAASGPIDAQNAGTFLTSFITFVNGTLVPVIFALAFIVFIWGLFQYFILGGANEEKREQGKQLVVWGIAALFVMSSLWGIVNLVRGTFSFGNPNTPTLPTFKVTN